MDQHQGCALHPGTDLQSCNDTRVSSGHVRSSEGTADQCQKGKAGDCARDSFPDLLTCVCLGSSSLGPRADHDHHLLLQAPGSQLPKPFPTICRLLLPGESVCPCSLQKQCSGQRLGSGANPPPVSLPLWHPPPQGAIKMKAPNQCAQLG